MQGNERTLNQAAFVDGLGVWSLHILWQYIYFGVLFTSVSTSPSTFKFGLKHYFSTTQPALAEQRLVNQGGMDLELFPPFNLG